MTKYYTVSDTTVHCFENASEELRKDLAKAVEKYSEIKPELLPALGLHCTKDDIVKLVGLADKVKAWDVALPQGCVDNVRAVTGYEMQFDFVYVYHKDCDGPLAITYAGRIMTPVINKVMGWNMKLMEELE